MPRHSTYCFGITQHSGVTVKRVGHRWVLPAAAAGRHSNSGLLPDLEALPRIGAGHGRMIMACSALPVQGVGNNVKLLPRSRSRTRLSGGAQPRFGHGWRWAAIVLSDLISCSFSLTRRLTRFTGLASRFPYPPFPHSVEMQNVAASPLSKTQYKRPRFRWDGGLSP